MRLNPASGRCDKQWRTIGVSCGEEVLIVGAVLGIGFFVVGATAVLGVVLGTRTLVVTAASVKPAAVLGTASAGEARSTAVLVAMRATAAAGN